MELSRRTTPKTMFFMLLISLVCIAAFLLVQFAFVDLFIFLNWETPNDALKIQNPGEYVTYVLFYSILIPAFEELVFRLGVFFLAFLFFEKIVFQKPTRLAPILAITISALAFALYHHSFNQLVYQFFLGLIFASAFYFTGNLLYSIFLHFINNFFIITYTFIAGTDIMEYSWNASTIVTCAVCSILGSAIIVSLFVKIRGENEPKQR
jgi:membrane protease YdiL (CAAX protease family)